MTTILIAEDHHIMREGVRLLLDQQYDLEVVGMASTCEELLRAVAFTRPDVLLLDVILNGENSLHYLGNVLEKSPRTRVVVLSLYANELYVLDALRNGASAYVLKTADPEEVLRAIRSVQDGQNYLSEPLTMQVIGNYVRRAGDPHADPYEDLTPRERQVLSYLAMGHDRTFIAARMEISTRTVDTHKANLMRKLNCATRADLQRFAMRRGLIQPDSPDNKLP